MEVTNLPPKEPASTITAREVSFTGDTGPIQVEAAPAYAFYTGPRGFPVSGPGLPDAFVVEVHTTDYNGSVPSQGTRIGYKIFPTGSYTNVEIPIFPDFRLQIELELNKSNKTFPPKPNGVADIRGFLFSNIGGDYGGGERSLLPGDPIRADITNLNQNSNLYPIQIGDGEFF
jgi:hypothetical protein